MSKSGPEKLKMESLDITLENIDKIAGLFPGVITEIEDEDGKIRKGIDFDLLKQELSGYYIEGREERYEFSWVGKKKSILEANRPIQKTLRPCMEESEDWENTKNIYIEGDNLEALKLLQESYLNSIKMIYIDPPYNTGNDFIYNDSFVMDEDEYDEKSGEVDETGSRLIKNSKDRGRYHSDWCSMLYSRLKLAYNLLREDGVIFVSIGKEEINSLIGIMNEIFSEECFKNIIVIRRGIKNVQAQFEDIDALNRGHEYILFYSKNQDYRFKKYYVNTELDDSESTGSWNNHWRGTDRPTMRYEIFGIKPERGQWRWSEERSQAAIKNWNELCEELGEKPDIKEIDEWVKNKEKFLNTKIDLLRLSKNNKPEHYIRPAEGKLASDLWLDLKPNGNNQLLRLFSEKVFDTPKSIDLILRLIELSNSNNNSIILDFFAGSCTTAHAVMKKNAEDGDNRRFIMVQLPEPCDEKSDVYKAGFKNISEIGRERIRRAGEQIKKENEGTNRKAKIEDGKKSIPDIGFRNFTIDDTNMKDVYYSAAEYSQETIEGLVDNVKEERTDIDLLYQILIDWGLPLDLQHEIEEFNGFHIHIIDKNALIACFDSNVPENVMRKIAEKKPLRAVFRDGSFKSSPGKLNIEGVFKTIAPDANIRVI
ncbi:MAG: site-specific DNA-methyltransferase [Acidobacteria bacterium]|nr:site-specific DNA-methyltransferase [Acidobacteriota bacterium]